MKHWNNNNNNNNNNNKKKKQPPILLEKDLSEDLRKQSLLGINGLTVTGGVHFLLN